MARAQLVLIILFAAASIHGWIYNQAGQDVSQLHYKTRLVSLVHKGASKRPTQLKPGRLSLLYVSTILLVNANDINLNPGPDTSSNSSTFYPCGACKESVTWNDQALMCDSCETWFHLNCQHVNEDSYDRLGASNVVWFCLACDGTNYSSILFNLHSIETNNRYSSLDESSFNSIGSVDSQNIGLPGFSSSPIKPKPKSACSSRPLRIINFNCQSLVNKKGPFYNLIDSSKPDIIIATETWFNQDIRDSEYFSSDFTVHRRDRGNDKTGGGILVAVNSTFISTREETLESPD